MKNRIVTVATFLLFITSIVVAEELPLLKGTQKVFTENGSIFYFFDGKNKIQLTRSEKDRNPILSPDKKKIVFIRKSNKDRTVQKLYTVSLNVTKTVFQPASLICTT